MNLHKRHLLVLALVPALAWSATRAFAAAPAVAPEPANDTIEQAMKQMNMSLKALNKGITAETQVQALEELAKFEQAVITAKAQTPDSAKEVDEKKRPEFVAEFRANLCEVLKTACDAEIAVAGGRFKDADGTLRKIGALKSAGHDKFKKDEEGGEGKGKGGKPK